MLTREIAARKDNTTGTSVELQHRHFAFIAATIKGMVAAHRNAVALSFADACRHSNPRFDRARFLLACGVDDRQ